MPTSVITPQQKNAPITSANGLFTDFWYLYYQSIATAISELQAQKTSTIINNSFGLKSPLDFGGIGNGTSDDSAAVAAAAALGYLWLPPNYTFLTRQVTITASDYCIFGGGGLKLIDGAGTDLLVFDGSAFTGTLYPGNGQYGHITNVVLNGNAANQPVNLGAALVLKNSAYTTVNDNLIYAGSGDGIRLENANGCFQADEVNIINNRIFSNGRHGIYAHSTCLPVSTTIAANVGTGLQTVTPASMANITVGATLIIANADTSNLEFLPVIAVTATSFLANFGSTKTGPGITVVSTFGHVGDHVIIGNHCNYNGRSGIKGIFLTSSTIGLNNVLTNATGIELLAADRCTFIGNPCRNNKGSGVILDQHLAVTYTDLVIGAANTTTSALHPFQDDDAGLQVSVTGGVGFTVQVVEILLVLGGVATCSAALGTPGSTGGTGSKNGFGRSKDCLVATNQIHYNGVQTTADELDVFNTDGCVIQGNYLGDTDFTPVAQYGIQLFNDTGIAILGNDFGPTIHGPLLAPADPVVNVGVAANIAIGAHTVTPAAMTNITVGRRLFIQGVALEEEIVTVTGITGTTFDAVFTQAHTGPVLVHASGQQPYRSLGNLGLADGMQGNQLDLPAPALNDYGILFSVTDYGHVLLWIGTQWVFQLGENGAGWIVNSVSGVLTNGVWHACDGTATPLLNGDGTTQQVTTPVLAAGFYIRK